MMGRSKVAPYLLVAPAVGTLLFTIGAPLIWLVKLSLYKTDFITSKYIGLGNYRTIFSDARFLSALINSGLYVLCIVPAQLAFCLVLAVLLTWLPNRWQLGGRLVISIPSMLAGVIISASWRWIFHPHRGVVNWALELARIEPVIWFSTRLTAIGPISMIHILTLSGGTAIIFYASFKSVTHEMLESAKIDGATIGQTARYIQVPMIGPTVAAMALISTVGVLQIFEWVYMLAPFEHAATVMYNIYHDGFLYSRHGQAAAESMVLMLVIIVTLTVQRKVQQWR